MGVHNQPNVAFDPLTPRSETTSYGKVSWERMIQAVEKVRERLRRAALALDGAGIPYAVAGGNAIAAWVSRVDEAAVRNTQDVDILVRRSDFPATINALTEAGFVYRHVANMNRFLDGPAASPREAVHIIFDSEKVKRDYPEPAPSVDEVEVTETFRLLALDALVRMKLTSFRDKDRTHLRDLIEVGLVNPTWLERLSPALAGRLKGILENPEG
jgi:hypothetical protein